MPSRRYAAGSVVRINGPNARAPTAATTSTATAGSGANAGSGPRSPAARAGTAPACDACDGSWKRTFAWLHNLKGLLVRYDRRAEIHEAFLALGCYPVCFTRLERSL
jgi:hypothetical protein